MLAVLKFPEIDPVALHLYGPIEIRWYGLAYVAGFLLGYYYFRKLAERSPLAITRTQIDNLLIWSMIGVVAGGRLGYVLFYDFLAYLETPLRILAIWDGGMSFHGGFLGIVLVIIAFARHHKFSIFALSDLFAVVTPIGLLLGRIANFINAELYGRPTDVPWAMIFPTDPLGLPRHPSQLYEAALEGLLLLAVLGLLFYRTRLPRHPGALTGVFCLGYAGARFFVEFFRKPDAHLGYIAFDWLTMGQLLSLPVALLGLYLIRHACREPGYERT